MITDEEIAELSEDPGLAFYEFEAIVRARLEKKLGGRPDGADRDACASYANEVLAAAIAYDIAELREWDRLLPANENFWDIFSNFQQAVTHCVMVQRIRNIPKARKNSVGLDGNTKRKIHHFIQQIRDEIDADHLLVDKKEDLLKKLNAFAAEVDKARTSLRAITDMFLSVCGALGEGAERAEPLRKWVDSIGYLIHGAKKSEDEARKALPAPPRRIEDLRRPSNDPPKLDDEIPF